MFPIPLSPHDATGIKYLEAFYDSSEATFPILFVLMAFAFVPTAWIAYIVREKGTKCKYQQARTCTITMLNYLVAMNASCVKVGNVMVTSLESFKQKGLH